MLARGPSSMAGLESSEIRQAGSASTRTCLPYLFVLGASARRDHGERHAKRVANRGPTRCSTIAGKMSRRPMIDQHPGSVSSIPIYKHEIPEKWVRRLLIHQMGGPSGARDLRYGANTACLTRLLPAAKVTIDDVEGRSVPACHRGRNRQVMLGAAEIRVVQTRQAGHHQ